MVQKVIHSVRNNINDMLHDIHRVVVNLIFLERTSYTDRILAQRSKCALVTSKFILTLFSSLISRLDSRTTIAVTRLRYV